jgi:hypothetical protein
VTDDRPRCSGTNGKTGAPCRAWPLHGTDRCLAHSDATARESVGFVAANGKAGRPRNPRPSEVARQLIEQNVLVLQRPYWRTLGYDVELGPDGPRLVELEAGGAKMHSTSGGYVSMSKHDDLGAMMAAAERLQDRVYGKPTQATEISGPDGGPVEVIDTSDPENVAALHALLGRRPAARKG